MKTPEHSQLAAYYRARIESAPDELQREFLRLALLHETASARPEIEPVLLRFRGIVRSDFFGRLLQGFE